MLADNHAGDTVGRGHAQDCLYGVKIQKSPIATHDETCRRWKCRNVEQRLHEVFEIVRLLKHRRAFTQSGRARTLIAEGRRWNGVDGDGSHTGELQETENWRKSSSRDSRNRSPANIHAARRLLAV